MELPTLECKRCGHDTLKWAWLAGIIDSDGSIYLNKEPRPDIDRGYGWRASMSVTNTHKGFLDSIQGVFSSGQIQQHSKEKEHHKQAYRLRFQANAMRQLLPEILPYLIVKKSQAELMIEVLLLLKDNHRGASVKGDKRLEEIYWQLVLLNGNRRRRNKFDRKGNKTT